MLRFRRKDLLLSQGLLLLAIYKKGHYGLLQAMRHLQTNHVFDTSTTRVGKTPSDTVPAIDAHCHGLSITPIESEKEHGQ